MAPLLFASLIAAALSLGIRSTTVLDAWQPHPVDRLLAGFAAGSALVWIALVFSWRWGAAEAGLGLVASLAPVGVYDVVRWFYRSRAQRVPWIVGAGRPLWVLSLRVVAAAVLVWVLVVAYAGIAAMLSSPPI